jgi:hypothetical protein
MAKQKKDQQKRSLVEIFGYDPCDVTAEARTLWELGGCPFTKKACVKINHDQSIIYGTCSVTSPYGDIIICPNRLYANGYKAIKNISKEVFGGDVPFYNFSEYIDKRAKVDECVVALGKNSGREVKVGGALSMDWILASIKKGSLDEIVGIEVQSIDITGNYRDAWHACKNLTKKTASAVIPSSQHGLNWANVHKRLIPQLIRKGLVFSRSKLCKSGLFFILPEIVYKKFEDVIGSDIPATDKAGRDTLTVLTYELGPKATQGKQRDLKQVRKMRFTLDEFSQRFISGPNLPSGTELDNAVRSILGL